MSMVGTRGRRGGRAVVELPTMARFWHHYFSKDRSYVREVNRRQDAGITLCDCQPSTLQRAHQGMVAMMQHQAEEEDTKNMVHPKQALTCLTINLYKEELLPSTAQRLQNVFAVLRTVPLESFTFLCYDNCPPNLFAILTADCLAPCPPTVKLSDCVLDSFVGAKLGELIGRTDEDSSSPPRQTLELLHCRVTSLGFFREMKRAISQRSPVEECLLAKLHMRNLALHESVGQSEAVSEMCELVARCPHLISLTFVLDREYGGNESWGNDCVGKLTRVFEKLSKLQHLDLGGTNFLAEALGQSIEQWFAALSSLNDLEELVLGNALCSGALPCLVKYLPFFQRIRKLELSSDNTVSSTPFELRLLNQLSSAIVRLSSLRELKVSFPPAYNNQFPASLLECLVKNQSSSQLEHISLSGNGTSRSHRQCQIHESWAQHISQLGPCLQVLDILIDSTDPEWPQLFAALRRNRFLTRGPGLEQSKPLDFPVKYIYSRNRLLQHIRENGEISLQSRQTWVVLLEGLANRRDGLDETPLYEFLQYNADGIFCKQKISRKRGRPS